MMPEKKPDAALFGFPGRTQMVGRRMPIAVEEAAPRVVGKQELADRLLRAVARERGQEELVADRLRKGRTEHSDRGGEDDAGLVAVADLADRVEQVARAVEIDPVALVEIGLRLAGYDRSEVEDQVGAIGDKLLRLARRGEIRNPRLDLERRAGRDLRRHDVVQRQLFDGGLAEAPVAGEPFGEFAADHSAAAENENMHLVPSDTASAAAHCLTTRSRRRRGGSGRSCSSTSSEAR